MKIAGKLYLILCFLLAAMSLQAQIRETKKTVLVVSSYSSDSERTARFMARFEQLMNEKKYNYTSTIAYMGFLGFESSHEWVSDMANMLKRYTEDELAAVVLLGHEAWISYLEQETIPNVPFYGCYMDEFGVPIPGNMPDFLYWYPEKKDLCAMARERGHTGGMINRYDVEANIELIKKIYPNTIRIAFVTDNSYEGAALGTLMREVVVEKYPELNLASLRGLSFSMSQMKVRMRALPENTVVLLGTWRVDKSGRYYQESSIKEIFPEGFNLPVFTMTGVGLGEWAVGGYIPQKEWNIDHIVEDIHRYNMGEDVESTFKFTESKYIFSKEKMEEYGLQKEQLPDGTMFVSEVDEEVLRYQRYLGITIVLVLVFLLMTTFIFFLLQRNKRVNRVLKVRNDELAVAKEQAEQSNKLKSAFLANMSHEIRTPLNAIVGFSELLKETDVSEEREEYWNIIHTNNDLLLRLIGDILDLSKMEAGMMDLRPERFDVALLFAEIHAAMEQRVNNGPSGGKVKLLVDNPYKTCMVTLDRNRISQVVANFVTNAIKFTMQGHIRMGYRVEGNGFRIYVEDTGIGIAKEKQEKVFERFYKLNDFAQGTGLGMSICRAIMDAMNGQIGVVSEEGKGSTFWAWFPCTDIELCKKDIPQDIANEEDDFKDVSDSNLRILVAEDNDNHYLLLERILNKHTSRVVHAYNGEETVNLAKKEEFDVIIMDVGMPVMDGLEATRLIREHNKQVFIIGCSAEAFEDVRLRVLEAGCDTFLSKPIAREKLLVSLREMLQAKDKKN